MIAVITGRTPKGKQANAVRRATTSESKGKNPDANVCDDCHAEVESIIGCPDGAEVCPDCFNSGAH